MIGAGVGGCYTAFRLAVGSREVTLYESGHRVGGRIWSVPVHGGGWAELGAMRLNTEAAPVMALLKHLGLTDALVPFPFGRPENVVQARGMLVHQRDFAHCARIPYRLGKREQGSDADELTLLAVESAVPGFGRLREKYHRAVREGRDADAASARALYRAAHGAALVQGEPLVEVSWPRVLAAALSHEALRLVADTDGYDMHPGGSAAWIDVLFGTPPQAEYVTLSCGMEDLPRALHTGFEEAGGRTRRGRRLCRIDRARRTGGTYELTFAVEDHTGRDTGRRERVQAETVVLALPQGALRRLAAGPGVFGSSWAEDLEAVEPVRASKLFLAYDEPWWRACGVRAGRSTTDLPLRQVWYEPGGASRLLLAAYPSGPSASLWDRFGTGPAHGEPASGATFDGGPPATAAAVAHAHRLLCRMHGVQAPPPVAACWQDWGRRPHSGAWHLWRTGRDPEQVAVRMRAPAPGASLHVVSDCWTEDPGSIPGALSCAEQVLQAHLGLPRPPWLS
ncbi:FAD-dependent oxidoreductase [Streptomyces sp. APSN-46.1]|uniref:flavin monoamine oxidase family protein n=1 Tax=Streptomyces sp. APSN-46.1 TaxID=2929049 RepID=UPI001FB2ABF4|nr:FAD-dependent oxidoreductase [Streptomyces sp. APSN-46.1]MCJ1677267.1 FAD-dependent oxidoreductase [Streptomyces sp. APSN-46.1]